MEEEDKLLCLEYKNANIKNADAPEVFRQKIIGKDFWVKIAKKFCGSMFLIWACNKNESDEPVEYTLLMECNPRMNAVLKKRFMMKMMRQLPFNFCCRKYRGEQSWRSLT